jgi:hypothetical protein
MRQTTDWLAEEERLEQTAKAKLLTAGESSEIKRKFELRAAFEYAAVMMVILFLGLLGWSGKVTVPGSNQADRVEYQNAFYRALDDGQSTGSVSFLKRTEYPLGLMPAITPDKTPLDEVLFPSEVYSPDSWRAEKDIAKVRAEVNLQEIDLSPPQSGRNKKKVWVPVRDLLGEAPREIK